MFLITEQIGWQSFSEEKKAEACNIVMVLSTHSFLVIFGSFVPFSGSMMLGFTRVTPG